MATTKCGEAATKCRQKPQLISAKFAYIINYVYSAGMAKLVDALDLGSSGETHKSSSLFTRTKIANKKIAEVFFSDFYLVFQELPTHKRLA